MARELCHGKLSTRLSAAHYGSARCPGAVSGCLGARGSSNCVQHARATSFRIGERQRPREYTNRSSEISERPTTTTPGHEVQLLSAAVIGRHLRNGHIGTFTAGIDHDF